FVHHRELDVSEAGDVPAGLRQACDEALTDRVVDHGKNDRDAAGRLLEFPDDRRGVGEDQVGRRDYQLRHICLDASTVAASKTIVDLDVAPLDPTECLKSLLKCPDTVL